MDIRVAAYGIITDGSQILLAHWNERGHSGWTLPGGGIDPGEDPADAVIREIFEETGFQAEVTGLIGIDSLVTPRTPATGSHPACPAAQPAYRLSGEDHRGRAAL